jgi:hypothetical protein
MKSAPAGMDITHAEFNALVGDPVTTLNKLTVTGVNDPSCDRC